MNSLLRPITNYIKNNIKHIKKRSMFTFHLRYVPPEAKWFDKHDYMPSGPVLRHILLKKYREAENPDFGPEFYMIFPYIYKL